LISIRCSYKEAVVPSRYYLVTVFLFCVLLSPAFATRNIIEGEQSVESHFTVAHTPPGTCHPYRELPVAARVETNQQGTLTLELFFRSLGSEQGYYRRAMEPVSHELYTTEIPARIVGDFGVEYYIVARLGMGTVQAGSIDSTFKVATEYSTGGGAPEWLPGDDFLETFEPPEDPRETYRAAQERKERQTKGGALGTQFALILILVLIGVLVYQRLGK
jgi:hypothetical protein